MGAYACDPASDNKCQIDSKKIDKEKLLLPQIKKQICPVCYLFGCTGWSGKFNLKLLKTGTDEPIINLNSPDINFRMIFLEKKNIEDDEKTLLQMTLKLIVDYGAIGGKTTLKPSEIPFKNEFNYGKGQHRDYGLIERSGNSGMLIERIGMKDVQTYLSSFSVGSNDREWPDLRFFWFIKGNFIDRAHHNAIVDRDDKGNYKTKSLDNLFLGGFIPQEKGNLYGDKNSASKKIFSFNGRDKDHQGRRAFGYLRTNESIDEFISKKLDFIPPDQVLKGTQVIELL